jgi:hypothetical protein
MDTKEFFMKNKILLVMLAAALVLGMTLVGCKDDAGGGSLIGTWVSDDDPDMVWTFTSSNWEITYDGYLYMIGTYTTSGGKLTIITTQFWDDGSSSVITIPPEDREPDTTNYSVKGNKLTMDGDTYTKQ